MTGHLQDKLRSNLGTARAGVSVTVWALVACGVFLLQANSLSSAVQTEATANQFRTEQEQTLSIARALDLDRRAQDIAAQKLRLDLLISEDPAAPPILERQMILQLSATKGSASVGGPLAQEPPTSLPRPHMMSSGNDDYRQDAIGYLPPLTADQLALTSQQTMSKIADQFGPINSSNFVTNDAGVQAWQFDNEDDITNELNQVEANQAAALIWLHDQIAEATAARIAILKKTGLAKDEVFTKVSEILPELMDQNNVQVGGPLIESATSAESDEPFSGFDNRTTDWDAGTALHDNDKALDQLAALNDVLIALPIRFPAAENRVWMSSHYGYRRDAFTKRKAFHSGLDLAGNYGVPVMATAEGVVVHAGRKGAYGNLVAISHGYGLKTRYAHLSRIDVKVGDVVAVGTPIGRIGSTGRSTGNHLHYEIWYNNNSRNPYSFVQAGRDLAALIASEK